MVKDAESHSSDDKKKRELIEARNQADVLVYTTEKALKDHGDKVDEATRKKIEDATEVLKKALEGEDTEDIRKKSEALAEASHKLAEVMYAKAQQTSSANEGAPPGNGGQKDSGGPEVVDAEFEEVDDDKK